MHAIERSPVWRLYYQRPSAGPMDSGKAVDEKGGEETGLDDEQES